MDQLILQQILSLHDINELHSLDGNDAIETTSESFRQELANALSLDEDENNVDAFIQGLNHLETTVSVVVEEAILNIDHALYEEFLHCQRLGDCLHPFNVLEQFLANLKTPCEEESRANFQDTEMASTEPTCDDGLRVGDRVWAQVKEEEDDPWEAAIVEDVRTIVQVDVDSEGVNHGAKVDEHVIDEGQESERKAEQTDDRRNDEPQFTEEYRIRFVELGLFAWVRPHRLILVEEEAETTVGPTKKQRFAECPICERHLKLNFHHIIPRTTHAKYLTTMREYKKQHRKDKSVTGLETTTINELFLEAREKDAKLTVKLFLNTYGVFVCRKCHACFHYAEDEATLARDWNTVAKLKSHPIVVKWAKYARTQKTNWKR